MKKRRNKGNRERVRATDSVNLVGQDMVMTERGYEAAESKRLQHGQQGAVHAPQLMNLSGNILPPKRGTRELLKLYSDSPWLRAIVGKIGRSVAETDWILYAKKNAAGRYVMPENLLSKGLHVRESLLLRELDVGTVDIINDHPLLEMLAAGTGNPRLNGFASLQVTQNHIDLVGEAFWLIETDELGIPVSYWPLPPSWINNFPTEAFPFYDVYVPGGESVRIPTTMIVPFIDPDPENPYVRGTGMGKALDDEIQVDEYAAKHIKSFFLNRARPDVIISGQFLNSKDAERLENQWKSDHQGFWKAFKPLFFSQKIDVKELSQSFESMQMVQVRKHERDTFVSVFGAPPEKFGIIGESKRSTINAADYFWNKDLIKPRVEMIRRIVQQVLVPRFDERLLLHYDTPVLQDEEFKLEAMRQMPATATINDWRKVQGLESLGPSGEALIVPLNSQILPVKDLNGLPLPTEDVVEESMRQRALARPEHYEKEIETDRIAGDIAKDVVSAVESAFGNMSKGMSQGFESLQHSAPKNRAGKE